MFQSEIMSSPLELQKKFSINDHEEDSDNECKVDEDPF